MSTVDPDPGNRAVWCEPGVRQTVFRDGEQDLVHLMAEALADGQLEGASAWRRYQMTLHILLPELRAGEMTLDGVHAAALYVAGRQ